MKTEPLLRFVNKVEFTESCWLWKDLLNPRTGYSAFWWGDRVSTGHRWSYAYFVGDPGKLQVDHLCRVRRCVNPDHLDLVTPAENIRRGLNGVLRTHCLKGHPFSGTNLRIRAGTRTRICRKCHVRRNLAARHRKRTKEEADA